MENVHDLEKSLMKWLHLENFQHLLLLVEII